MEPADDTANNTADFIKALEEEDLQKLRRIPKSDLHNHALVGGRLSTYREWTGEDLPNPPESFEDFQDFDTYILKDIAYPYLEKPPEAKAAFLRFFLGEAVKEAIADGITVLEASIDCGLSSFYKGGMAEMIDDCRRTVALTMEAAGSPPLDFRPELGMARGFPLELLDGLVATALQTGYFRSIDLYGDERIGGLEEYVPYFRMAGEKGLRKKAHAGELRDADWVLQSVRALDLDAVQHGIAAAEEPAVMDFLAERGTVLNVCPTSNVRLRRAPSLAEHPVRKLFDAGIPVTINSDDLMVFDSSVSEEYLKLKQCALFSPQELDQIRLTGLA
jgi:adenosine deaminase